MLNGVPIGAGFREVFSWNDQITKKDIQKNMINHKNPAYNFIMIYYISPNIQSL